MSYHWTHPTFAQTMCLACPPGLPNPYTWPAPLVCPAHIPGLPLPFLLVPNLLVPFPLVPYLLVPYLLVPYPLVPLPSGALPPGALTLWCPTLWCPTLWCPTHWCPTLWYSPLPSHHTAPRPAPAPLLHHCHSFPPSPWPVLYSRSSTTSPGLPPTPAHPTPPLPSPPLPWPALNSHSSTPSPPLPWPPLPWPALCSHHPPPPLPWPACPLLPARRGGSLHSRCAAKGPGQAPANVCQRRRAAGTPHHNRAGGASCGCICGRKHGECGGVGIAHGAVKHKKKITTECHSL